MKYIEEIVVESFIPTVRSMLAERLHEKSLTQRQIADAIGVSQSSVSKYSHGEVARDSRVVEHEAVRTRVERTADGLAEGTLEPVGALIELEVLIRELETPGELLATMHEEAVPELRSYDATFRIHDPQSEVRARDRVKRSMRRALGRLERSPAFLEEIPQVGSNVVECLPTATQIEEVAGVPGRLLRVGGRLAIPGDPAFGESQHVAEVLLAARDGGSQTRAAINIRYADRTLEQLAASGLTHVEIPGDRDLSEAVRSNIEAAPHATVIAQTGAFGIEPIIYVLGEDAVRVCELVLSAIEAE